MKVFIVTTGESGDYGRYGIDRVFLDESKASQYSDATWDSRVETFETSDDEVEGIKGYHVIVASYGPDSEGKYKSSVYSTIRSSQTKSNAVLISPGSGSSCESSQRLYITRTTPETVGYLTTTTLHA